MIIGEKISITVVYKGKKYRSVFDINTDGSYDDVCRAAADIVRECSFSMPMFFRSKDHCILSFQLFTVSKTKNLSKF